MDFPDKYFSCSNLKSFIKIIIDVLPFSGISDSKFFLCEVRGKQFLTKLSLYKKTDPELYGRHHQHHLHPIDTEMAILHTFKTEFIDTNITPCILQLLYSKKCNDISKILPADINCDNYVFTEKFTNYDDYVHHIFCDFNKLIKNNLARDSVAFLVMERGDITFRSYLESYNDNSPIDVVMFKSLLFQIIYTLYRIKQKYPKFRHNDLHVENIMLIFDSQFTYNPEKPMFLLFGKKKPFVVPYFGVICKIIDFGYSILPELQLISNISDDKLWTYYHIDNDIIGLFCSIYDTVKEKNNTYLSSILQEFDETNSFLYCDAEYIRRIKLPSINDIMLNKMWDIYRTDIPKPASIYKWFDG